jgi:hypothetical protein
MTRCVVIWEHRFRVAQRVVNYIYTDLQGVFFYLVSFFELFAFQASQVPPSMEMALLNAAAGDPYRTETDSDEETEYAPATAEGGAGGAEVDGVAGSSTMTTREWLSKQPPLQPMPEPDEVVGKRMRAEVLLSDAEDATPEVEVKKRSLGKMTHVTTDGKYVCTMCGKGYTDSSNLRAHERFHTELPKHHCKKCGKSFYRGDRLAGHMQSHLRKEGRLAAKEARLATSTDSTTLVFPSKSKIATSTDSTTLVLPSKPKIATSTDSTTLVPPPLAPRVYKIPALPPVNLQNFLYDPAPSPYTLRVPVLHVGLDDAKTRRDRLAAR